MFSFYTVPSFHAPVAAPQSTLTSLFRLLDDFDTYSRRPQHRQPPYQRRQGQTQVFRPRFDACETETSYELHGDLPGVSKEHLDIQFTGPQTLVVKGRVVRQYELDRPEESEPQPEQPAQAAEPQPESTARTEPEPDTESEKKDEFVVVNKHQATVEDDPEEESIGTLSVSSSSPVPTPAETPKTTEVTKPAPTPVSAAETTEKKQDTDKVCVFERIVGEFERTFEFPGRVDQEAVSATLENGVLHISVPKAVTRRIFVN